MEETLQKRQKELENAFIDVDESKKVLVSNLIKEVVFLEGRMDELRQMPFIEVHPKIPAKQRPTAAARQYKECAQSYMNAIRILIGILRDVEASAADDLLRRLDEFL